MSNEERSDTDHSESETSIESKIIRTPATQLSAELSQEKNPETTKEK